MKKKLKKILDLFFEGKNINEIAQELSSSATEIKTIMLSALSSTTNTSASVATGASYRLDLFEPAGTGKSANFYQAYIDGASRGNPGAAACGVVIITPEGREYLYGRSLGQRTNNEAEYEALLLALNQLKTLGARQVRILSDSNLLINQMQGNFKVKQPHLRRLFLQAINLVREFDKVEFIHIPREQNRRADSLANDYIKLDNE